MTAELRESSFTRLPYEGGGFCAVVDVVSLQHINLDDSRLALQEVCRILKPVGVFFSYRLSDHSVMYEHSGGGRIDAVTVDNIFVASLLLSNIGPVSFVSPALAHMMYQEAGLNIQAIEHVSRTYASGAYVEYLAIVACRPE